MDRKEEFDLDEVMQVFTTQAPPAPLTVKLDPEPEPISELIPELIPEPVQEVSSDTIRLDDIQKAVAAAQGTDAVKITQEDLTQTQSFTLPEEFVMQWEPEDEEPMDDIPIPEPVLHRPKSRLGELRQKLVEGPEKRYYELSEQGVRKLQLAVIANLLLVLLALGGTLLYVLGIIPAQRLRLLVFAQFLSLILSALLSYHQLIEGITDLVQGRFTPNTLLFFSSLVCCVDSVLCLGQLRLSVCAVFSLQTTMSLWAAYNRRNTEMGQMDTLRRASNLNGLACVEEDYRGMTGFRICRGEVEHFMDHYNETSGPDRLLNGYCLAVTVTSLAIALMGGFFHGFGAAVQLCCASLMVGMPATAFLATVRPLEVLEKRLHKLGTVICGWQAVKGLRRRIAVPLNDKDLFPAGSVKLNGVKFYADYEPDQVVAYTAALIKSNGGALEELFEQLRQSRNVRPCEVEDFRIYDGGIGGMINGVGVMVGTLQFMQDMHVEMGRGTRVNQAVYAAINGELCGVFAVAYSKAKSSAAGIRTLCACRSVIPVLTTKDFMLTESFIRGKFGVNTRRLVFADRDTTTEICDRKAPEEAKVVALTTKEGLAPMAFAITGARTLGSAMKTGVIIHMVGGILGLLIMAALAYIGSMELLSPLNVLLYQLVWMVPALLVTEWTRTL